MKKGLVLIVILFLGNSFTLLAQINNTDTAASKNAVAKSSVSKNLSDTTAKANNKLDKKAAEKALNQIDKKKQTDSLASLKGIKPAINKTKEDSTKSIKKPLSKKELAKLAKANQTDSLSTKSKIKPPKAKSAKELKREAKKNDINRLSEKALAKMAFQYLSADSSIRNSSVTRADIAFTNARPLILVEPDVHNVKFFHRYWRDIELQDPKNKKLAQYHADFIAALLEAIKKKQINAYNPIATPTNPSGDAFISIIPYDQFMSGLSDTAFVNVLDKDGNITGTKSVPNPFAPDKISGYRIKEDVFYDKTRSKSITRIIGIAPLVKLTLSSGELLSVQPLVWLKYKDCRKIMVTIDVDPSKKTGDSMDDIFLQRHFYGRIVQESNADGKRIKDYKTELSDQEAEVLRIEKKIATFKNGSWSYTMLTEAPPADITPNKPAVKNKKTKTTAAIPPK